MEAYSPPDRKPTERWHEHVADRDIPVWKLVAQHGTSSTNSKPVVAACVIPEGACYETGGNDEFKWYRSTDLHIDACGAWIEEDPGTIPTYCVFPTQKEPYLTYAGAEGRVTYTPGTYTSDVVNGLWTYEQPWQTYWPYSKHVATHKCLDASVCGRGRVNYVI
jgi:hypothetical protein